MSWGFSVLEVYIIACLFVVHLSLLFCKADHCAFDATFALKLIPDTVLGVISKMLAIIPISLSNLQLVGHFLLIGDAFLLIMFVLKFLGSIIRYILWVFLLTVTISFVVYLATQTNGTQHFQYLKQKGTQILSKVKM